MAITRRFLISTILPSELRMALTSDDLTFPTNITMQYARLAVARGILLLSSLFMVSLLAGAAFSERGAPAIGFLGYVDSLAKYSTENAANALIQGIIMMAILSLIPVLLLWRYSLAAFLVNIPVIVLSGLVIGEIAAYTYSDIILTLFIGLAYANRLICRDTPSHKFMVPVFIGIGITLAYLCFSQFDLPRTYAAGNWMGAIVIFGILPFAISLQISHLAEAFTYTLRIETIQYKAPVAVLNITLFFFWAMMIEYAIYRLFSHKSEHR